MIHSSSWLPADIVQDLGWTLIHFVWQGAAIAALAAALMGFCNRPSVRYLAGVGALALMMATPIATFLLFYDSLLHPPSSPAHFAFSVLDSSSRNILPWLVQGWFAGVVLLSLRFIGGFRLLEQMYRQQSIAPGVSILALCRDVQRRLGINRTIRYLECGWLRVPAAIGFIRPVIFLPAAALIGLSEVQLRAVIAHELAHVRRWDFLVNLFQVLTEALLFYHPALWWLNKRIRAERELCCDDIAVSVAGDRVEYADALMQMAKRGSASGLAMAATHGILSERVFHILDCGGLGAKFRIAGLAGSLLFLTASLSAGYAIFAITSLPGLHSVESQPMASSKAGLPSPLRRVASDAADTSKDTPVTKRNIQNILVRLAPVPPKASALPAATTAPPEPHLVSRLAQMDAPNIPVFNLPEDKLAVPETQTDVPSAHYSYSRAAQLIAARTVSDNEYPAPVLKLLGPFGWHEGSFAEAMTYCKDYAVQTVTQGANRPIAADDGVKQRLSFFYWHCMLSNGKMETNGQEPTIPAYTPVGPASPDHPVDVSGSWMVSIYGQPARSCSFTRLGNTISGTCMGLEGSGAATGVIDGRQVRWVWKYAPNDELDFIGTVGPDGEMTGQSIALDKPLEITDQLVIFTATQGDSLTQVASQN